MKSSIGIVVFGDVVTSRRSAPHASRWLRSLRAELDRHYGDARLARFDFTQGDELQGLLASTADPFEAIVHASVHAEWLPMRWAISVGPVDPGRGPATQRTGAAFLQARQALTAARTERAGLVVVTGDAATDTLLADVAPAFKTLLDDLTDRQREIARLLLVEGLRQADVATRLSIARPTVSVAAERARIREIEGLAHALLTVLRSGIERIERTAGGAP